MGECSRALCLDMGKTRKVVLYGNSLVLSAIESCLRERSELELLRIDAGQPGSAEQLDALSQDTVIFDVHSVSPEFGFAFLQRHPGISLVGFDLTNAKMTLVSSQESAVFTTDDLIKVIRRPNESPKIA